MSEYPPDNESDEYDPIKDPLLAVIAGHVERLTDSPHAMRAHQSGDNGLVTLDTPITARQTWQSLAERGEMASDEGIEQLTFARNAILYQEAYDEILELVDIVEHSLLHNPGTRFDTVDWLQARYGTKSGSIVVTKTSLLYPNHSFTATQHTVTQIKEPLYRSTKIVTLDGAISSVTATTGDSDAPPIMRTQAIEPVEHADLEWLYTTLSAIW